jgi:predicted metal-dependent peptidase
MALTPTKKGWAAQDKTSNLTLARAYVKQYAPYMSSTLYGLVPSPVPGLTELVHGPMAVSERLVLYYDPAWIETVSMLIVATGLMHECMHAQLLHIKRGRAFADPKRFNRAGDLFINSTMRHQQKQVRTPKGGANSSGIVTEDMWEFPDWALMPERYGFPEGLTADEYYALLEQFENKNKSKGQGKGSAQGTCKNGQDQSEEGEPTPGEGESGEGKILAGCCGGIAGNPVSKELEAVHNDEKGRSEADCKNIAMETARAIKKHMESQQGRGTLPGSWAELVDISEAQFEVPWRTKLANLARLAIGRVRTGGLDYSMRRPSKRSYLRGIMLPGLIAYDPNLMFIVDSSGSMGTSQLADALKVMSDVMVQTGIQKAWFLDADTEAKRVPILVSPQDLRTLEFLGRGGTDFCSVINYIDTEFTPRPNMIIYLTDGAGTAPEHCPNGIQFIWCIVPTRFKAKPADWGEIIELDDLVDDEEDVA